jgi:hypothetical protein
MKLINPTTAVKVPVTKGIELATGWRYYRQIFGAG